MSLQAFLAMPSVNKSSVSLKIEEDKTTGINKIKYNLYMGDLFVATYIIYKDTKINSIQLYEAGY